LTRKYLLEQACQAVLQNMKLRKPQLDCIKKFHEIFVDLPGKLAEVSPEQILEVFRSHRPGWDWRAGFPEMTCALATGVGKTRLMGALMAYLFKAKESENFLLLAPRTTIVDKLVRECQISDPKYIFVDPSFVGQPIVYHPGNFRTHNRRKRTPDSGPTVWIASPQAIARTDADTLHFHRPTEYLGTSQYDYLKSLRDLVVFFDESHHLGEEQSDSVAVWTQGVRNLSPRLLFAMTASPRPNANILHAYPLTECLKDELYTKAVQVIVKQRPDKMQDVDWDKTTLRFAMSRLAVKEEALRHYGELAGFDTVVNPIILVCAKDIHHAEEISKWLGTQIGNESVLMVHSNMQEKEYLGKLLSVEQPNQKIRAVVNVFKLTEGWDVTNVYVIAPLRALATATGVLQTMGRGLRLPYGKRVDDLEIDALDVLCFGREAMNEIVDQVLSAGFGRREGREAYIKVSQDTDVSTTVPTKPYCMEPVRKIEWVLPSVDLEMPAIDLSTLQIPPKLAREALAIDLSDPETIRKLEGKLGFDWGVFISIVTSLTSKKRKIIGSITNSKDIRNAIEKYLIDAGLKKGSTVRIEPELAALHLVKAIDGILSTRKAVYKRGKGDTRIKADALDIYVPTQFNGEIDNADLNFETWKPKHRGWPVSGWRRCIYKAVPFDNSTELHVAKIIDRSEEVELWLRNLREIFHLNTPIGTYSPDFLFVLKMRGLNVLLEVKGEYLVGGTESEAVVKASAADAWCKAVSAISSEKWEYWLVLDQDAKKAQSIGELRKIADEWRTLMSE
jgi:superfamily II DNA or RNA helicase